MGFPWKKLFGIGKAAAAMFLPGIVISSINTIEQTAMELKESGQDMPGPARRAAVLKMAASAVEAIEGAIEKDVVNDPKVVEATGSFIDAYVAMMNAIAAAKQAKA